MRPADQTRQRATDLTITADTGLTPHGDVVGVERQITPNIDESEVVDEDEEEERSEH